MCWLSLSERVNGGKQGRPWCNCRPGYTCTNCNDPHQCKINYRESFVGITGEVFFSRSCDSCCSCLHDLLCVSSSFSVHVRRHHVHGSSKYVLMFVSHVGLMCACWFA